MRVVVAVMLGLGLATVAGAQSCDPNYDWACVPIASDVDCAGGSGNGPAYVQGPVLVIGRDVYGLDRNGDGYGCEPRGFDPARYQASVAPLS